MPQVLDQDKDLRKTRKIHHNPSFFPLFSHASVPGSLGEEKYDFGYVKIGISIRHPSGNLE